MEPCDYLQPPGTVDQLQQKLNELLLADHSSHKKVQAFSKRLIKHKDSIFTFLYHAKVPPDNNGSERAIRNVKVKTKVSGQFRTQRGAQRFAILRSIIGTTRKNTNQVFKALTLLFKLQPE